jgi:hypothetical protein
MLLGTLWQLLALLSPQHCFRQHLQPTHMLLCCI